MSYKTMFMLLTFVLPAFLLSPVTAHTGSYSCSAHGNKTNGVNRTGLPGGVYSIGNCAHCHEQHSSINGTEPNPGNGADSHLLLSESNSSATPFYTPSSNACFQCHSSSSIQVGGIINYDYSGTFNNFIGSSGSGGPSPKSIMDAFNKSNRHDLKDIHSYTKNNFAWFGDKNNACCACHNPHLAKQSKRHQTERSYAVMSLPGDHNNLYGDSANESADDFDVSATYIAPNGDPSGEQTPDYNTFCLSCHDKAVPTSIIRTDYHGNDPTKYMAIDWTTPGGDSNQSGVFFDPGDKHGVNTATGYAAVDSPYTTPSNLPANAVLSCINCHEAHGSENDYMHRRYINGSPLGVVISGVTNDRGMHCLPCHTEDAGGNQWKDTHHGGGFSNDNPYRGRVTGRACDYCHGSTSRWSPDFPIPCEDCHFHGSYVDEYDKYTPEGAAKGVKYVKPDFAPYRRKTF